MQTSLQASSETATENVQVSPKLQTQHKKAKSVRNFPEKYIVAHFILIKVEKQWKR